MEPWGEQSGERWILQERVMSYLRLRAVFGGKEGHGREGKNLWECMIR